MNTRVEKYETKRLQENKSTSLQECKITRVHTRNSKQLQKYNALLYKISKKIKKKIHA